MASTKAQRERLIDAQRSMQKRLEKVYTHAL